MTRLTATRTFMSLSGGRCRLWLSRLHNGRPGSGVPGRPRHVAGAKYGGDEVVSTPGGVASLAVGPRLPQHIAAAAVVEVAAQHEEMVGEPVDIADRGRINRLGGGERSDRALRAPRHRASQMEI